MFYSPGVPVNFSGPISSSCLSPGQAAGALELSLLRQKTKVCTALTSVYSDLAYTQLLLIYYALPISLMVV